MLTSDITPEVNHPIIITTLDVVDSPGQTNNYFESIPNSIQIDHTSSNMTIEVPIRITPNSELRWTR